MKFIIGLGNPGKKYSKNRHNSGFVVIDYLADKLGLTFGFEKKFKAEISTGKIDQAEITLIKPQTYMNNSGQTVSSIINFYKISLADLIIIHDDIDLAFGVIRTSKDMGSAGHKGVQSIIEALGSQEFTRIRVGVGKPEDKTFEAVERYVLSNFSDAESERLRHELVPQAIQELQKLLE